jgi:hypothetical protein
MYSGETEKNIKKVYGTVELNMDADDSADLVEELHLYLRLEKFYRTSPQYGKMLCSECNEPMKIDENETGLCRRGSSQDYTIKAVFGCEKCHRVGGMNYVLPPLLPPEYYRMKERAEADRKYMAQQNRENRGQYFNG